MLTPEYAVLCAMLVCAGGAGAALIPQRHKTAAGWIAFLTTALSSLLIWSSVLMVLTSGPSRAITFWASPQFGFALRIHVDGLSALFLALIATIALPAAFYSIEYLNHYTQANPRRYYPNFLLFIAGMYGIVSTTDTFFFFFIFWQLMTLTSYALVRFESQNPANVRAANKYLLMMQIACALTLIGAEMLAATAVTVGNETMGKYDFEAISQHLPRLLSLKSGWVAAAFALFLAGFGIKVGMWPFGQIWLPDAHPAAPSPVSALLSGVMIKTGIYGLMRYFLWLVPPDLVQDYPSETWGLVIAVLGTITLVTGTAQALQQEQSKRLLAYHSIGQVGYVLLGLGACLALIKSDLIGLATLAFCGAMFHTLNHGLFKSLLFLNAGSMLCATGTQDLNEMGGLGKVMPATAITALIASFSIAGVPLFNGFASKWSIYVATIRGGLIAPYLPLCAVLAIITSVLTLASFIKFYGSSFLSRPSARVIRRVQSQSLLEVHWMMRLPQWGLAGLCLFTGLFPNTALGLIQTALNHSRQGLGAQLADTPFFAASAWTGIDGFNGEARLAPLAVAALLGVALIAVRALSRLGHAPVTAAATWLCGYVTETDQARYRAHHFYGVLKHYVRRLGGVVRPQRATSADHSTPPPPMDHPSS